MIGSGTKLPERGSSGTGFRSLITIATLVVRLTNEAEIFKPSYAKSNWLVEATSVVTGITVSF